MRHDGGPSGVVDEVVEPTVPLDRRVDQAVGLVLHADVGADVAGVARERLGDRGAGVDR